MGVASGPPIHSHHASGRANAHRTRLLSLAFYLPQFHRVPENDAWWEPGFTEWTHLERARSWFPDHRVRHPVAPLGRYDLRDGRTIEAQQVLAAAHGIDGFLIWDYWLGGGRRLLHEPVDMILSQRLEVSYALAWANHDWVDRLRRRVLARQLYGGASDYAAYFEHCLPHFRSDRYVCVDGKPLFFVYRPESIPDLPVFVDTWRTLARKHGLAGLWLVGDVQRAHTPCPPGLDAYSCSFGFWTSGKLGWRNLLKDRLRRHLRIETSPQRLDARRLMRGFLPSFTDEAYVPTLISGWDTTPRHGRNGVVVQGMTPAFLREQLQSIGSMIDRQQRSTKLLLIKSWNEWAEGNVMEPDDVYGDAFLREYHGFVQGRLARWAEQGI